MNIYLNIFLHLNQIYQKQKIEGVPAIFLQIIDRKAEKSPLTSDFLLISLLKKQIIWPIPLIPPLLSAKHNLKSRILDLTLSFFCKSRIKKAEKSPLTSDFLQNPFPKAENLTYTPYFLQIHPQIPSLPLKKDFIHQFGEWNLLKQINYSS